MVVLTQRRYKGERVHPARGDFSLEPGYLIERLIGGLTYPSNVEVSPDGEIFFAEAGFTYPYVFVAPRLNRLLPDGTSERMATSFDPPIVGMAWHEGSLLVTHRGSLARVSMTGEIEPLVEGLPSLGDHHTNHIVVRDEWVYFGQGAATNAGVVGVDNLVPYGWLAAHRNVHDVPPYDVTLTGLDFTSHDPFDPFITVRTGAFMPFGTYSMPDQVIEGSLKANSVVYRCHPDGSGLEVFCWGLRNPYALAASPDGRLWTIDQGGDDRGSRPFVSNDVLFELKPGAWYGFPDFLGGRPATELAAEAYPEMENPEGFVMADHPERSDPAYVFPEPHVAATQLDFSRNDDFGHYGQAFVTNLGAGAPITTGGRMVRTGQSVVRLDVTTMEQSVFYRNENPGFGGHGPERPVALRFSPDGTELYVIDHGKLGVPKTGALWRIRPS